MTLAAGCPAVVVVGVAGGVGVGVGAGGGGGAVARPAPRGACRARRGDAAAAVTVTVGTVTVRRRSPVPPAASRVRLCGVSGAVSAPAEWSATAGGSFRGRWSRRLRRLRWRRRRLRRCGAGETKRHERRTAQKKQTPGTDRHHSPHIPRRERPVPQRSTHHGETAPDGGIGAAVADARPRGHRIDVRRWEVRALRTASVMVSCYIELDAASIGARPENTRQRQRRRFGRHQRAGEVDERANRAIVVGEAREIPCPRDRRRRRSMPTRERPRASMRAARPGYVPLEMHVPERQRELDGQREQREIRTQSRTRPKPAHCRHARCVARAAEPLHRPSRTLVTV